uniref:Uncharacterized protein n=1 Tax=Piliocolobus tephrosceles TaxID=591936 RepID=A0A8C9LH68_9PRIM
VTGWMATLEKPHTLACWRKRSNRTCVEPDRTQDAVQEPRGLPRSHTVLQHRHFVFLPLSSGAHPSVPTSSVGHVENSGVLSLPGSSSCCLFKCLLLRGLKCLLYLLLLYYQNLTGLVGLSLPSLADQQGSGLLPGSGAILPQPAEQPRVALRRRRKKKA